MKISTKGRYALRLMIELALCDNDGWTSLKDISERQQISIKYLEQIVNILGKSGLIRSTRGAQGGYRLSKPALEYTAGEIIRSIEGNIAPVACLECQPNMCERKGICSTIEFWEGLNDTINSYIDSVTLAELAEKSVKK